VTKQLFIPNKLKTKLLLLLTFCFALTTHTATAQLLDVQPYQQPSFVSDYGAAQLTSGKKAASALQNKKNITVAQASAGGAGAKAAGSSAYDIKIPAADKIVKQRPQTLGDSDARQDYKKLNVKFNPAVQTHPGANQKKVNEIKSRADASEKATLQAVAQGDLQSAVAIQSMANTPAQRIAQTMAQEYLNPCSIDRMENIYKSGCYSCIIVKAMISTFLNACSKLYDLTREAGAKILIIGLLLWIPFYILQQLSSLKNLEPAAMINDLLQMLFKVLVAYLVINAGIQFFIDFVISPLLNAGADFGSMILSAASPVTGLDMESIQLDESNLIEDNKVMPRSLLNNIMVYVAAVSGTVSTHMEIGHMITCFSTHAGAWGWQSPIGLIGIVNLFLWLSGAAIWFMGFMMTLSVTYYLVDISFKIGFVIIALPIVVGLWPFNITKDRLGTCVSMVLNAAGIFLFLAMTITIGLTLVSHALDMASVTPELAASAQERGLEIKDMSGAQKIMLAVEEGNTQYVSSNFSLFSGYFLLLAFAYLYALKIIGSTISDYVNTFFPDSVLGSASPMHQKLVQYTDIAKQKALRALKFGGKALKHQAKNLLKGKPSDGRNKSPIKAAQKTNERLDNLKEGKYNQKQEQPKQSTADSMKEMAQMNSDKDKKAIKAAAKGTSAAAKGTKAAAKGLQAASAAAEASGRVVETSAQLTEHGSDAAMKGGKALVEAGGLLSATILGSIIGVPLMVVGGTVVGAGAAGKVSAKAMKVAGKVMQKGGKVMKKIGKRMEQIANKMDDAAKKLEEKGKSQIKQGREQMKNNKNKNNQQSGDNAQSGGGQEEGGLIGTMEKTTRDGIRKKK